MSSITFQSVSGEARIGGSERAYMSSLVERMCDGLLDLQGLVTHKIMTKPQKRALAELAGFEIQKDHSLRDRMTLERIRYWLFPTFCPKPQGSINGKEYHPWYVQLNTAIKYGSDAIAFAARLHAQCEIHGYVPEKYRGWLADIIEGSLNSGIYRECGQGYGGWEPVIALLRKGDGGPVVTHYSVCDSFLGTASYHLTGGFENKQDAWHDQPHDEKWKQAVEWLTSQPEGGAVWNPETLRLLFGEGEDALWLRRNLEEAIEATTKPECGRCSGYGRLYEDLNYASVCGVCRGTGEAMEAKACEG